MKQGAQDVQGRFTSPDDDWVPILLVKSPDGIGLAMVTITDDKQATADMLQESLRSNKATEAVLITSAWTISRGLGEQFDPERDFPICEQPDRQEVLVLTHVTTESAAMYMANINRHADTPPTLGEWQEQVDGPQVAGIFVDAMRKGIG